MPAKRLQRVLLLSGIISLFIAYLGLWFRFINDPVERTGSDFISFYSVGRIAQDEGPAFAYEPLLQQKAQQEVVGFDLVPGQVLLNLHLPFIIPILQAVVSSDYVASFYWWNLLMVVCYIASLLLLGQLLKKKGLDSGSIWITCLGGLLFYPIYFSLWNGQDTALCFLGLSIWAFGLLTGREGIAGLGLSLTTVRPQIAIIIAIPMFFRYRKVFWGFVVGSSLLALVSVALLGIEGTRSFINIILISTQGEWFGLNEKQMFNLIGLLLRTTDRWLTQDTIHTLGWLAFAAALIFLSWLSRKQELKNGYLGLLVITAVFVSPHLHYHDLTLLLIPIFELIWMRRETNEQEKTLTLAWPVIVSFLLLLGNSSTFLHYTTPYLLMLALAVYPFYSNNGSVVTSPHRS